MDALALYVCADRGDVRERRLRVTRMNVVSSSRADQHA